MNLMLDIKIIVEEKIQKMSHLLMKDSLLLALDSKEIGLIKENLNLTMRMRLLIKENKVYAPLTQDTSKIRCLTRFQEALRMNKLHNLEIYQTKVIHIAHLNQYYR